MSTALYRKWRSQNFDEVIGQEHVTQTLRNALRDDRVAHAYLFAGPRGTGKTSTARILAKALNCAAPQPQRPCNQCATCVAINEGRMIDLIEIDAASNNSVDDIRDLREKVGFRPSEGRFKIYIIDEVHMLSNSAFNALLKTLEEPPAHTRFILATTEPHKLPATVISRCQRFDFRRIPVPEIAAHLRHIVQAEGFQAEDEALTAIARSAQGCMRDAVSLLDQMFSAGANTVTFAQVQQSLGAVSMQLVSEFVDAVATRTAANGLALVQALVTQGASLVEFCHQLVEHLRAVMLMQMTGDPTLLSDWPSDLVQQVQRQTRQLPAATTLFAIKRFSSAVAELKGGFQPQLPLEMALIEVIAGAPITAPEPVHVATAVQPAQPTAHPEQTPATPGPTPPALATDAAKPQAPDGAPPPIDVNTVRRLRERWKEFSNAVRTQCGQQAWAALAAVRDIAVADESVVFAFGNNEFSRNLIAKPETTGKICGLLSSYLRRPVSLECQMGDEARLTATARSTAVQEEKGGPDPLVEFAVTTLGAEVVDS